MKRKVGIYLPDKISREYGSVRIRGANLVKYLSASLDTEIIHSLESVEEFSHIILPQKTVAHSTVPLLKKKSETIYLYDVCDFFIDKSRKTLFYDILQEVDIITIASYPFHMYLNSKIIDDKKNLYYIPDIIEVNFDKKEHSQKDNLDIFWYGFKENLQNIKSILNVIKEIEGVNLTIMSDTAEADYPWDLQIWENLLSSADIGISPLGNSLNFHTIVEFKSSHKITSFMARGLPVIASPIGEYQNIIKNGINGYIARSEKDWVEYIHKLKNTQVRNLISENSYNTALKYKGEQIAIIWDLIISDYALSSEKVMVEELRQA